MADVASHGGVRGHVICQCHSRVNTRPQSTRLCMQISALVPISPPPSRVPLLISSGVLENFSWEAKGWARRTKVSQYKLVNGNSPVGV